MEKVLKDKLLNIVELVNKNMADPDIDVEYCIPGVEESASNCTPSGDPLVIVKYAEDKYTERRFNLTRYLDRPTEDIANHITFALEQFKLEIDSLKMGD